MSLLDNLPTAMVIYSPSNVADGMGGYNINWTLVTTTKCRLYSRSKKMTISDRGMNNDIETKAILNILDRANLVTGYKAVVDDIEYVVKRPDVVYGRSAPHHMECVMELFKSNG